MSKELSIVKNVLINCMGMKKKDGLLIVSDDRLCSLAGIFHKGAVQLNFKSTFLIISVLEAHGQEPGEIIADIFKKFDLALLITSKSLSHTKARKEASRLGVRIASLPGINYEVMMRSLDLDYNKIKTKADNLAQKLTKSDRIRVTTSRGTDICFSVKGRKGFSDSGIYKKKGAFGNLPAGEACIAPLEGLAQGVIVVDGSIAGFGKLKKPVKIIVKNGLLIKTVPDRFEKFLNRYGRKGKNLAEFGVGLNPKAKVTGCVLEDEKACGTVHFAFGTNISFGGEVDAGIHIDAVLHSPQIYLDGSRFA
ncbi:MAG TPA: aminopeptidase [Candidatus Omnitrophica bacterium]|nr:aminopeptidase [Candidatus Omnitrophota bacterium]